MRGPLTGGPPSAERLRERGRALFALLDRGADIDAFITLDNRVRAGERTDWPGRPPGPERRSPAAPASSSDPRNSSRP